MSFTADELQSLNDILETKLAVHRREMESVFDQRVQTLRHEIERRLNTLQQEIIQTLYQKQAEQQRSLQTALSEKLNTQQLNITQAVDLELKQQQQPQIESMVDRALAAQLSAIEELFNHRLSAHTFDEGAIQVGEHPPHFEAIEVQTELPWEDLTNIFGKALDERYSKLNELTQSTMRNLEQFLSAQLRVMQTQILEGVIQVRQTQAYNGSLTSLQEVFQSIEQLERIIESMQVAMTANHALLSNRLYHHQQLPLERAHASARPTPPSAHPNGTNTNSPLSLPGERPGI
jgi:hypothetical protein